MEARPGPPGSRLGDRLITHPCIKKALLQKLKLKSLELLWINDDHMEKSM